MFHIALSVSRAPLAVLIVGSVLQTIFVDGSNANCPGSGTLGDPYCTIQTAINASVNGDTIEVAPGTYVENLNLAGKSISIESRDGKLATIIDGSAAGAVVTASASETFALDGFTIRNGSASSGGGVNCILCTVTLTNSTVSGNSAVIEGGGLFVVFGSLTIENSTISGNSASSYGGGVSSYGSTAAITNATIVGNSVSGYAGGVSNYGGTVTITQCTISGNSAGLGGASYTIFGSTTNIKNSILWGDSPNEVVGANVSFSDIQGGHWGTGNINLDPKFLDAAVDDFRLACDSPCLDVGDPAVNVSPFDFEGDDRVVDGDSDGTATPDMGSDEFDALWSLNGPPVVGSPVSFTAQAPPAQSGNVALVFVSLGNGAASDGVKVPASGGQRLYIDLGFLFGLWSGLPAPVRQVTLSACPGSTTAPVTIPSGTNVGLRIFYAGFTVDGFGAVPSVTPTHSFVTQ